MATATGIITTIMDDAAALVRLFSWLSPAFPIGGFAFSQGLETAIVSGAVADGDSLREWVAGGMAAGSIRTDAIMLALAHGAVRRDDAAGFAEITALALALQVSAERDAETREQARSFIAAAGAWPVAMPAWLTSALATDSAFPAAVGAMAAVHALPARPVLAGFINGIVSQQISVAVRLVPLGQSEGLKVLAGLEPAVAELAGFAAAATIEDLGGVGYAADIAAMAHATLPTRIFRS